MTEPLKEFIGRMSAEGEAEGAQLGHRFNEMGLPTFESFAGHLSHETLSQLAGILAVEIARRRADRNNLFPY